MEKEAYLKKFRRMIYEYTTFANGVVEDAPAQDPNAAAAAPADPAMGAGMAQDPTMGGAMPAADPNAAAPADPAMGAGMAQDPTMGGAMPAAAPGAAPAPAAPAQPAEVEGLTPPQEGEGKDTVSDAEFDAATDKQSDATKEIIDNQEKADETINRLSSRFEEVISKIDGVIEKIAANDEHIASLEARLDKSNPTPEQKLSMRSLKGEPYVNAPQEYWDNIEAKAPNYSPEDDMNGEKMPEYTIKQSDIDGIKDWRSISKSFDDERLGLKDIFGY